MSVANAGPSRKDLRRIRTDYCPKSVKLELIDDLTVMPEGWSPDFEWRERKIIDGDVVIEDVTTLSDRREGCAAKAVIRRRRRGLLRWFFGD